MIQINNLTKSYNKIPVLKGVTLSIVPGNIVAIMGPNGSGKTTILKCVLGLVRPDSGEIFVKDININNGADYRQFIGYMPQTPRYPENLKVKELIKMLKDITSPLPLPASPPRGHRPKGRSTITYDEELINALKLETIFNKSFGTLSAGTKQRVSCALAFLFNREIVILDEPTAGLDPVSAELVKEKIIKERNNGKLIIITSHITSEVEKLAERVIFMLEGEIHLDSSIDELKKMTGEDNLNKAVASLMTNNK